MTAVRERRQSLEEIEKELEGTNARLAESVEVVAYRAGHAGEELKRAAKHRLDGAKDEVKVTVRQRAAQAKSLLLEKKDQFAGAWKARSRPKG